MTNWLNSLINKLKRNHMWIGRSIVILIAIIAFFSPLIEILINPFIGNNFLTSYFSQIDINQVYFTLFFIILWINVEIFNRIPNIIEKNLKSEYKLKFIESPEINKEIEEKFENAKEIKIFAYTNETLLNTLDTDYVRNRNKEVKIKILCRNWESEEKDENIYNEKYSKILANSKSESGPRKWTKSEKIPHFAKIFEALSNETKNVTLEQKFYDSLPFFKGYIFDNKEAYLGEYQWVEKPFNEPEKGGSQYKGRGRPMSYYNSDTASGELRVKVILSLFENLWDKSKTFEEINGLNEN